MKIEIYLVGVIGVCLLTTSSCKKENEGELPVLITDVVTSITQTTAICGGNITNDGGENVTYRGVCWSVSKGPTINLSTKTNDGTGIGSFTSNINGLTPATTYFVRAYATNSVGTSYGSEVSFTTPTISTISTTSITAITSTTAITGGNITNDGGSLIIGKGVCWSTINNPTIDLSTKTNDGTGIGSFTSNINGLTPATTYYVRAYATNSVGTAYGSEVFFMTGKAAPTALTLAPIMITSISATLNGTVIANGYSSTVSFEYGTSESYGNTTIAIQSPILEGANTNVSKTITDLVEGTTYHYRVKATNNLGTTYGNDIIFNTPATITDADGNVYNTVTIGTQTWIMENLKTTKYSNGDAIVNITDMYKWGDQVFGAYCWYDNDINNKNTYGAIYNYFTVEGTRNLCPTGWHIPTNTEWETLKNYLGGSQIAGGKLKEVSTSHWLTPNTGATNESGFTARAGGYRDYFGTFRSINEKGYWWSSTKSGYYQGYRAVMYNSLSSVGWTTEDRQVGSSVRCVKD